jgi:tripartite-type tricarboxylate transporter receptor subunit TctC
MKLPHRRKFLHLAAGAVALSASNEPILAQGLAGKTLKIIVPFAPGGLSDVLARVLAQKITEDSGQSVLIESRPGAGTVIGTEAVARAAPDGTTVLIVSGGFILIPNLRALNYHPLTSFEPICQLVTTPTVFAVNISSPFQSLTEFLAAARSRPGALSVASIGPASGFQVAVEVLKRAADVNLTYVPYPGGNQAVNALLGEHVAAVTANYVDVMEQVKSGKVRPLAILSRDRAGLLPDVPTIADLGYMDIEVTTWNGVVAPAKTPIQTAAFLSALFTSALAAPDIKTKLISLGMFPAPMSSADFGAYLKSQYEYYARYIRELNIKAE